MLERLADLAAEHAQLERDLSDPAVHADQEKARALGRRYSELTPIVHAYSQWQQVSDDEATAVELAAEDPSFADEAQQ
ncbi:MAG TPA: PCRF domain-containing protein, partial [Streptosporangiaceae bacterium]